MNVPDLMLERYRLGELPPAEADRLARRLAEDGALRQRLEAIDVSDQAFARDGLSPWLAGSVRGRMNQPALAGKPGPGLWERWGVTVFVTATLAFLLLSPAFFWRDQGEDPDCCADRPKGPAATLMIYRDTGAGSETLADNDVVRTGDVVRVGYRAADRGFAAIVSIDGRGMLTRHLPVEAPQAAPLEPGRLVLLDRAFELDDAPALERFYLITAPSPFEVPAVMEAVRRASTGIGRGISQPLSLPDGFTHVVFSLRKETRP